MKPTLTEGIDVSLERADIISDFQYDIASTVFYALVISRHKIHVQTPTRFVRY